MQGELALQTTALHYTVSIGLTSQIDVSGEDHHGEGGNNSLNDFDILNPKPDDHKIGYAVKLVYFPDTLEETQVGSFFNHSKIAFKPESHLPSLNNRNKNTENEYISLAVLGVFANYQQEALRLISEAYYFSTKVPTEHDTHTNNFFAAYIQVNYALNEMWTPFIRFDRTFSHKNDPYLTLLNGYPVNANTLGIRLEFLQNNALKLEYSRRKFNHEETGLWFMNWSAVW